MVGAISPGSLKERQDGLQDPGQKNKKAPFGEGPERIFQCLKGIMPQEYHPVNVFGEIVLVRFAGDRIWPEKAPDVGASSPETGDLRIVPERNMPRICLRARMDPMFIFWLVLADAGKLIVKALINLLLPRAMFLTGQRT